MSNNNVTESVVENQDQRQESLHAQAREFMHANGLNYRGDFPETKGKEVIKKHFEDDEGNQIKSRCWLKCCYLERADGTPGLCITFGRHDKPKDIPDSKTFWEDSASWNGLSDEEKAAAKKLREEHQTRSRIVAEREKAFADELADKSLDRFHRSMDQRPPENTITYFSKKELGIPHDVRYLHWECVRDHSDGETRELWVAIVAMRDGKGDIRAIQELWPEKRQFGKDQKPRDKHFIGSTSGNFYVIGGLNNGEKIHVFEGVATAISGFNSTNTCSVAAMDCGNLEKVVRVIKQRYPNSEITICADNDHHQVNNPKVKRNPGLDTARAVAISYHCKLAIPEFPEGKWFDDEGKARTDFDDLRQLCGMEIVKAQIEESIIPNVKSVPTQEDKKKKKQKALSNSKLFPSKYLCNEDGVFLIQQAQDGGDEKKRICGPIWPVAHLRDQNNRDHTLLVEVFDGEKHHKIPISKKTILKYSELSDLLADFNQDPPVNPSMQKHLQEYLQRLSPDKKMRCVRKTGWHGEQYVFGDGTITAAQEPDEGVYLISGQPPNGVGHQGTLVEWQQNVVGLCAQNSRLIFSLGTAFASLCLRLIDEDGGGFHFKGKSSRGKTKCLKVAISVLGSPNLIRGWKTTANALEGLCAQHNDSLLPLDEIGRADSAEAGEMVYSISAGTEKSRLNRDSTLRPARTWTVLVFSTGEVGLEAHVAKGKNIIRAGQAVRMADIPAEANSGYGCFETIHEFSNGRAFADELDARCAKYYGTAGRAFLEGILTNTINEAKAFLMDNREAFVKKHANGADGQVLRVCSRFGMVYAALKYANKLGILGNELPNEQIDWAIDLLFSDWKNDRGGDRDQEFTQILKNVVGILRKYSDSRFMDYQDSNPRPLNETWGYRDGSKFYVYPKAFEDELCKVGDKRQVRKVLADAGILEPGNDGKGSKGAKIHSRKDNKNIRFWIINLKDLDEENGCE